MENEGNEYDFPQSTVVKIRILTSQESIIESYSSENENTLRIKYIQQSRIFQKASSFISRSVSVSLRTSDI